MTTGVVETSSVSVAELFPTAAVTVALPLASPVTSPLVPERLLTEAIVGELELQVTELVRSWVEPSLKVPVAVRWRVAPMPSAGFAGVMDSDVKVLTASVAEPETPRVALMTVVPLLVFAATASPRDPAALLIVATPGSDEAQVTRLVRSAVVPSGKVPVAVNCWVVPATAVALAGVTTIKVGARTVTAIGVADTPTRVAARVVEPGARAVATPPAATVTMAGVPELQRTFVVRSGVVPSDRVPVAVNCRLAPTSRLGLPVLIARERSAAVVMVVLPETPAKLAVIVVLPAPPPALTAVASPCDPVRLLMVAIAELDELQRT